MTSRRRGLRARLRGRLATGRHRMLKAIRAPSAPEKSHPGASSTTLGEFEFMMSHRANRVVVILAHQTQLQALGPWLGQFQQDQVFVVSEDEAPEWRLDQERATHLDADSLARVSQRVKSLPAIDVIVNLLPGDLLPKGAKDHHEVWARIFKFMRPGGTYIVDRRHASAGESTRGLVRWMGVLSAVEDPEAKAELGSRDTELARATRNVAVSRDFIVVTKRLMHFVKLRDSQVYTILPAREPELDVQDIQSLKPGKLVAEGRAVSHESATPVEHLEPVIEYPALYVRQYNGRVALAGSSLMYTGLTILPDSFRWHLADNPGNPRLKAVSHNFARIDSAYRPNRTLPGRYYQLDSAYPNHFGHLTTEVVSKLWGWDVAKKQFPDLKAIFHVKPGSLRRPSLEIALFTAYGIDEADIIWVNEPVWLESVVSASPMWHNENPHYVHPSIRTTWRRLSSGLAIEPAKTADRPADRIFVSRSGSFNHRFCRNAAEVEAFFEARGFQVLYPEHLSMADQVRAFASAKTIAGFGGSAMFNLMHAEQVETVILLAHEAYTARNEHLFTSVLGCDTHYFWSLPEVAHPPGGWTHAAFYSPWEFDFERNGRTLDELIGSL